MPTVTKTSSAKWPVALLLVGIGGVCGYVSFIGLTKNMWGGSSQSQYEGLFLVACLVSVAAFLSGMVLFLAIALKAVASNSGSASGRALRSPAAVKYPALTLFRIAAISVIALASLDMLQRGWPSLSSRYGQFELLKAIITLLLSQLPFAVALIRTWRTDDHAGLALAIAAATLQGIDTLPFFLTLLNLPATAWTSWSILHILLGAVLVVLASLVWRASGWREGDAGLMVSIFFGFLAYTVLWSIAFEMLSARAFNGYTR